MRAAPYNNSTRRQKTEPIPARRTVFIIHHSSFSIQHSAFNIRHSKPLSLATFHHAAADRCRPAPRQKIRPIFPAISGHVFPQAKSPASLTLPAISTSMAGLNRGVIMWAEARATGLGMTQKDEPVEKQPILDEGRELAPEPRSAARHALAPDMPSLGHDTMAIISDIHANLEALTAVLADIDGRGIKTIVCLGDVVGYGPNPLECIDLVIARCKFSLMGNHDFAIFFEPHNFNTAAENAAYWTRAQFEGDKDIERRNRRWRYLGSMLTRASNDRFVAFHGSPRRPINEYVFPDDIYTNPTKMASIFDRIAHLCFVGHTHVPGVFVTDPDFYSPDELGGAFDITESRAMINVGSVGQPRDRNPAASYVLLHSKKIEFVRVTYDVQTTVDKVKAIDALDNFLGLRLLDGR